MGTYQKKLIPVNITVMLLSLVAAISIMFLPLITIDMSKGTEAITNIIESGMSDENGTDNGSSSESDQPLDMDVIMDSLSSVKFSVTTMSFAKIAFDEDPIYTLAGEVGGILSQAADQLMVGMLTMQLSQMGDDLPIDTENIEVEKVYDKIKELETTSEPDAVISEIAEMIAEQGDIPVGDRANFIEEAEKTMHEFYDKTVDSTGEFTIEGMVCSIASDLGGEGQQGQQPSEPIQNYQDLVYNAISGSMGTEMSNILKISAISVFGLMTFVAVLWAILFLFALVHLISSNKRFTMWYVKLFGFLPCLIFGVLPLVAQSLLKSLIGTEIAAILGIVSSLTWISGACYLLLWIVSIFWAFPIKRKIRKTGSNG